MVAYPAKLDFDVQGMVVLTMPDVPELVLVARRESDALSKAPAVLDSILSGYRCQHRSLPAPSQICGAPMVTPRRFCLADAD